MEPITMKRNWVFGSGVQPFHVSRGGEVYRRVAPNKYAGFWAMPLSPLLGTLLLESKRRGY